MIFVFPIPFTCPFSLQRKEKKRGSKEKEKKEKKERSRNVMNKVVGMGLWG